MKKHYPKFRKPMPPPAKVFKSKRQRLLNKAMNKAEDEEMKPKKTSKIMVEVDSKTEIIIKTDDLLKIMIYYCDRIRELEKTVFQYEGWYI